MTGDRIAELLARVEDEETREALAEEIALVRDAALELEHLSSADLCDALKKRFESGAIALFNDLGDERYETLTPVWGAPPTILGLLDVTRVNMVEALRRAAAGASEEEDDQ